MPTRLYRELVRQGRQDAAARGRFNAANPQFADDRLAPVSVQERKVAGLGEFDVKRFLDRNVSGRQTIFGGPGTAAVKVGTRAFRDAVSLPANVVTGGYYTGKALVDATPIPGVKGSDTRQASQLWRAFKETDPVALAVQGRFREAGEEASQHPLAAYLEFAGTAGGVSRALGRASRPGRALAEVEGTNIGVVRSEPQGVVGRAVHRGRQGVARSRSEKLAERARQAEIDGHLDRADELAAKSLRADPDRVTDKEIAHHVDVAVEGLNQSVRRPHRSAAAGEAREALGYRRRPSRRGQRPRGGEAISLVTQNIAKASKEDLARYVDELDAEFRTGGLRPAKAKANRRTRATLNRALNGNADMAEVERAARAYARVAVPGQRELVAAGMLEKAEAERAALKGYAVRKMGAHDDGKALVDAKGEPLSTEAIKAHMRAAGIDPESTAFVSHAPRGLGDGAFNVTSRKAPGVSTKRRTGEAVRQGTLDLDPELLVEQHVKTRGLVDANTSWKRFVGTMAARDGKGKLETRSSRDEAQALASDLEASSGRRWRVIRLNPWLGREEQLQRVVRDADAEGFVGKGKQPVADALDAALAPDGKTAGPFAVVPEAAAARLQEHAGVYRSQGPVGRTVTQAFRNTVLPLSPSWLTGNVIEGSLRAAVAGAGPRSWLTFRRVYNQLAVGDPSIRQALRRLPEAKGGSDAERLLHMVPGGHFGGTHDTMIRTSAKQFEGHVLEPVARALSKLAEKPGPGTLAHAYRKYSDWIFSTFNGMIEAQFTRSIAGKHIRQELMSRESRRSMERAVEQAAKGVNNTPEQVAMADFVRRAYGQYDSLPPWARKTILTYTPFGMWTFNAAKFLFQVLPRDHPMLTAVLAANHQLTEDWRKQQGLDFYAMSPVPGFLQGSIPLPGGRHLRIARYTPFGLFAGSGGPLEAVASNVLPQFSGPYMAFKGLDWKGNRLRGADGKELTDPWAIAKAGAQEFALANVPAIGMAIDVAKKGPSRLNPFRAVPPSKSQRSKDPIDSALDDVEVDSAIDDALKDVDSQLDDALK